MPRLSAPVKPKSEPVHRWKNGFELHGLPELLTRGVTGLVGGFGKTTALMILAGKLDPNGGWHALRERYKSGFLSDVIRMLDGDELAVSYKPQAVERLRHLPDMLRNLGDLKLDFDAIHELRLGGYEHKSAEDLDASELQRISVAAALSKDADLYILDEPSEHLDILQKWRIAKLIKAKGRHAPVIVSDSDVTFMRWACDSVSIFYGDDDWSVPSKLYGPKDGVASFIEGVLHSEQLRIRETKTGESPEQRAKRLAVTPELLIELRGVQKRFDDGMMHVADTDICRNERIGLLGADGNGKTSLLKIIIGKDDKFSGLMRGKVKISYKSQHLSQRAVLKGLSKDVLKALDISLRGHPTLNRSLQQRIAIARCLGADADVYVLDQPSDGLRAEERLAVIELLKSKRCVIVSDHDAWLVARVADRCGLAVWDKDNSRIDWMSANEAIDMIIRG